MKSEAQKEHLWLQKFLGEWTYELDCPAEPGKPPSKHTGSESVRSLGGLWILAEGKGQMPDGTPSATLMTVGYDPQKKRFVGTWIGSMMCNLWVYDGEVDASAKVLSLSAEGPAFDGSGKTALYRDVIEFKSDDLRVLTSHVKGDDGTWTQFMAADYRRKK